MGIVLITVGLLISGVVSLIISDGDNFFGFLCTVIASVLLIIMSIIIGGTQISRNVTYQNVLYQREILEYRLDNVKENTVGNELIYSEIVAFNNDLREAKEWASNPWTNWFCVDVATIDYIEIKIKE